MIKVGMRAFAAVLLAAMAALLPGPIASAAGPHTPGVDYVYDATNDYRAMSGFTPLAFDTNLQAVAQAWAEQMAADYAGGMSLTNAFRHNPNLTAQIPAGWQSVGENIAYNGGYGAPLAKLMDQWKTSPPHNANMLNPNWTAMGIGVYTDPGGLTWGVQVFAKYSPPTWVPPVVTLSAPVSPLANSPVTLTVSVTPSAAATARLWVRAPGGTWTASSTTFAVANGAGSKTITAPIQAQDYKIQVLGAFSNVIAMTPEFPTVTVTGPTSLTPGATATMAVAVSGDASGTGSLQYQLPGQAWGTSSLPVNVVNGVGSVTFGQSAPTMSYRVVFNGGVSNAVAINLEVPTVSLTGPSTLAPGAKATMAVAVSGNASGTGTLQYLVPGQAWGTSSLPVTIVNGVGSVTFGQSAPTMSYRVAFNGGVSNAVAINLTAPAVPTITASGPSTLVAGAKATLTVAVSPSASGTGTLQYLIPGQAWGTSSLPVNIVNGVGSVTFGQSAPTMSYRVVFNGGVSNAVAISVALPTVSVTAPSTLAAGSTATMAVAVSGNASGTGSLQYLIPGQAWGTSSLPVNVANGVASVTFGQSAPTMSYRVVFGGVVSNAVAINLSAPVVPTVTASGPSTLIAGAKATMTVAVDPSASGTGTLQYLIPGQAWGTSSLPVTIVNGVGSVMFGQSAPTMSYRVVFNGGVSNAVAINLAVPSVTVTAPSTLAPGAKATMAVAVSGNASGTGSLQYLIPGQAWGTSSLPVNIVNGVGSVTFGQSAPTMSYRVVFGGVTSNAIAINLGTA